MNLDVQVELQAVPAIYSETYSGEQSESSTVHGDDSREPRRCSGQLTVQAMCIQFLL